MSGFQSGTHSFFCIISVIVPRSLFVVGKVKSCPCFQI